MWRGLSRRRCPESNPLRLMPRAALWSEMPFVASMKRVNLNVAIVMPACSLRPISERASPQRSICLTRAPISLCVCMCQTWDLWGWCFNYLAILMTCFVVKQPFQWKQSVPRTVFRDRTFIGPVFGSFPFFIFAPCHI